MTTPDKQSPEREITYRVGWKKGKIHPQEQQGRITADSAAALQEKALSSGARFLRLMWREAPYPGERTAGLAVIALPAVAFAAVVWLVALLSQG